MRIIFTLAAAAVCMNGVAAEFFVATNGCDGADGSAARPWRTIQRAADIAVASDTVTIRAGVYREWVKPANAGRADAPITYQAAKGEKVVVTGADPVRGWTRRPGRPHRRRREGSRLVAGRPLDRAVPRKRPDARHGPEG